MLPTCIIRACLVRERARARARAREREITAPRDAKRKDSHLLRLRLLLPFCPLLPALPPSRIAPRLAPVALALAFSVLPATILPCLSSVREFPAPPPAKVHPTPR